MQIVEIVYVEIVYEIVEIVEIVYEIVEIVAANSRKSICKL